MDNKEILAKIKALKKKYWFKKIGILHTGGRPVFISGTLSQPYVTISEEDGSITFASFEGQKISSLFNSKEISLGVFNHFEDNFYLMDEKKGMVFNPEGKMIKTLGEFSERKYDDIQYAGQIKGFLLVNKIENRVDVLSWDGKITPFFDYQKHLSQEQKSSGRKIWLTRLAYNERRIYAVGWENKNIIVLDWGGNLIEQIPIPGDFENGWSGIGLDDENNFYLSNYFHGVIVKLTPEGEQIFSIRLMDDICYAPALIYHSKVFYPHLFACDVRHKVLWHYVLNEVME